MDQLTYTLVDPLEIHGEPVAGRSAIVRKSLQNLTVKVNTSVFDLAELLYEAQENNYAHQWGFESLAAYAEQELGLKPRKSQYLARIVKTYKTVGLTREQVEHVSISKLREITRLNPEGSYFNQATGKNEELSEHIVKLITDADEMTLGKVKEEIARLMGMTGVNQRVVRSYTTDLSSWQNVIQPALELARMKLGSNGRDDEGAAKEYSDGAVLEVICADFLSDPGNQPQVELPEEEQGLTQGLPMEVPSEID